MALFAEVDDDPLSNDSYDPFQTDMDRGDMEHGYYALPSEPGPDSEQDMKPININVKISVRTHESEQDNKAIEEDNKAIEEEEFRFYEEEDYKNPFRFVLKTIGYIVLTPFFIVALLVHIIFLTFWKCMRFFNDTKYFDEEFYEEEDYKNPFRFMLKTIGLGIAWLVMTPLIMAALAIYTFILRLPCILLEGLFNS